MFILHDNMTCTDQHILSSSSSPPVIAVNVVSINIHRRYQQRRRSISVIIIVAIMSLSLSLPLLPAHQYHHHQHQHQQHQHHHHPIMYLFTAGTSRVRDWYGYEYSYKCTILVRVYTATGPYCTSTSTSMLSRRILYSYLPRRLDSEPPGLPLENVLVRALLVRVLYSYRTPVGRLVLGATARKAGGRLLTWSCGRVRYSTVPYGYRMRSSPSTPVPIRKILFFPDYLFSFLVLLIFVGKSQ